jgi:hypothetical protein
MEGELTAEIDVLRRKIVAALIRMIRLQVIKQLRNYGDSAPAAPRNFRRTSG